MTSLSPSFGDLLNTNRAPTEQEEKIVHALIADHDDNVGRVNQMIDELQTRIQGLKKEKENLLEAVIPLKQVLSLIRRLPEDIIRSIFTACIDPEIIPSMSKAEAPTLLTQICSGMRKTAMTTPALWAAIGIPNVISIARSNIKAAVDGVAQRFNEWLRRSGTLPLRIIFHESDSGGLGSTAEYIFAVLMDTFLSCSSRWGDISLIYESRSTLSRLALLNPAQVPNLQSFYLRSKYITFPNTADDGVWQALSICRTPMLKRFGLCMLTNTSKTFGINWKGLTHLALDFILSESTEMNDTAQILCQCESLLSLDIAVPHTSLLEIRNIRLPFLKHLKVMELCGHGNFRGLLEAINAPNLNTLDFNTNVGREQEMSPNLMALLKQTPNLAELIVNRVATVNLLSECLRHCPHLRSLDILNLGLPGENVDSILSQFVLDDTSLCLCPKLEYFRSPSYILAVSGKCLQDLIRRKQGTVSHLKKWKYLRLSIICLEQDRQIVEKYVGTGPTKTDGVKFDVLFQRPNSGSPNTSYRVGGPTDCEDFPRTLIWPYTPEE